MRDGGGHARRTGPLRHGPRDRAARRRPARRMNVRPAMRKPLAWLLGLLGLGVIAFAATRLLPDRSANGVPAATRVPATPVDPANEGRLVEVRGELRVGVPPRDPQLGVGG